MKKKILMLSAYFPYPPNNGGKGRIYNLVKHLSAKCDIYFLSFIENPDMLLLVPELEKYCKEVHVVLRDENKKIENNEVPRTVSFFYTQAMIDKLQEVVKSIKPDLVQIDFLVMTQYVNHIKNIPVIYVEHDMAILNFSQSFHDRDLPEKERFVEWARLIKYEKSILEKFNSVIALTERDIKLLNKFLPLNRLFLAPTGVDINYFKPSKHVAEGNNIVFVGHYRHYPNYDAVKYFLDAVFPLVLKKLPDAVFYAVGSGAEKKLMDMGAENIIITGEVPDLRPYIRKAKVFAAPVRLGGGIKGKILEAMACGVPVVASKEVSKGINCTANKDILVAANSKDFALKTVKLLKDEKLNRKIASAARKLVERYYDWRQIAVKLDKYYDVLIRTDN